MNMEEIEYHICKLKLHQLFALKRFINTEIELSKSVTRYPDLKVCNNGNE